MFFSTNNNMSVVHLLTFDSNFHNCNFVKKTRITNEWADIQKELTNINHIKKTFKILKYNSLLNKCFNLKPHKKTSNNTRVTRNNININDIVTWYSENSKKDLNGRIIHISPGSIKIVILDNSYNDTNIIDKASNNTLNIARRIIKLS